MLTQMDIELRLALIGLKEVEQMATHNWCHGVHCHTRSTLDRVRGSKGNKVLRTRKINLDSEYIRTSMWAYFCSQSCLMDFIREHLDRIVALDPRPKALETPINDPKKEQQSGWSGNTYWSTRITKKEEIA